MAEQDAVRDQHVVEAGPADHLGNTLQPEAIDYRAPSGILLAESAGWPALVVALSFVLGSASPRCTRDA